MPDGPLLPIEFARISQDKRLTLVICPEAERQQVLWAKMKTNSLEDAIDHLRKREETTEKRIGFIELSDQKSYRCGVLSGILEEIRNWAGIKKLSSVIWTDLPPNFKIKTNYELNAKNVIEYLNSLLIGDKKRAELYIRKTPKQIRTKMRFAIEESFGWTPLDEQ